MLTCFTMDACIPIVFVCQLSGIISLNRLRIISLSYKVMKRMLRKGTTIALILKNKFIVSS